MNDRGYKRGEEVYCTYDEVNEKNGSGECLWAPCDDEGNCVFETCNARADCTNQLCLRQTYVQKSTSVNLTKTDWICGQCETAEDCMDDADYKDHEADDLTCR